MKKLLLMLCSIFLIGCASTSNFKYSAKDRIYRNDKFGIRVKIPEGWKKKVFKTYDIGFTSGRGAIFVKVGKLRIKNNKTEVENLIKSLKQAAPNIIKNMRKNRDTIKLQYKVHDVTFKKDPILITSSAHFFNEDSVKMGNLREEFLAPTIDQSKLFNIFFVIKIKGKPSKTQTEVFRNEFNELINSFLSHF